MTGKLAAMCLLGVLGGIACGSSDDRRVAAVPTVDGGAAGNGSHYTGGISPGSGSSNSSDTPEVTTDVKPEVLLSDLTDTEAVSLCKAVVKASESGFDEDRAVHLSCYVYALSYAILEDGTLDEAWCMLELDNCLSQIKKSSPPTCDKSAIAPQFSACNAKVGDLETCIEQSAAELRRLLDGLKCNEASYTAVDKYFATARPAPCRAVIAECPSLDLSRTSEMGLTPSPTGCDNNCPFARDGLCDDGGPGSKLAVCGLGTDCDDCGHR